MKPEEAIEILEEVKELDDTMYAYNPAYMNSLDMAIESLKEIQQYREIGTVEECREAMEKQKPKKIIIKPYCPTKCPTCDHELSTSLGDGYYKYPTFLERCPNCGQVIQWEDLEEMKDEQP